MHGGAPGRDEVGDRLAQPLPLVLALDGRTHALEDTKDSVAGRIHADIGEADLTRFREHRRRERNAADEMSPGIRNSNGVMVPVGSKSIVSWAEGNLMR
jgi:hypothetical protein